MELRKTNVHGVFENEEKHKFFTVSIKEYSDIIHYRDAIIPAIEILTREYVIQDDDTRGCINALCDFAQNLMQWDYDNVWLQEKQPA